MAKVQDMVLGTQKFIATKIATNTVKRSPLLPIKLKWFFFSFFFLWHTVHILFQIGCPFAHLIQYILYVAFMLAELIDGSQKPNNFQDDKKGGKYFSPN